MSEDSKQNMGSNLPPCPELDRALLDQLFSFVQQSVKSAFARRRDGFVFALSNRLRGATVVGGVQEQKAESPQTPWVDIESLSRLRSVVGGRFENIKKRWVDAGFPLREHRGDKQKDFEVDRDGWSELSNWLLKHGFESRLTPERADCLFQVRETQR